MRIVSQRADACDAPAQGKPASLHDTTNTHREICQTTLTSWGSSSWTTENCCLTAWYIVWDHKHLFVLGILAGLSGGGASSSGTNYSFSGEEAENVFGQMPSLGQFDAWMGVAVFAAIALLGMLLVVALLFWVVSQIAQGGLIAGVNRIEAGEDSSFGTAWQAGWQRALTLVGIGLVPLIPLLVLLLAGIGVGILFYGLDALFRGGAAIRTAGIGVGVVAVALVCLIAPIMLALALLSTFAYRACMLEATGVWASYQRGWQVLIDNIGPALILFILQLAINIGLAIVLLIPGLLMAFCCLFWPVLLAIQGAITAYFSTVWTLAWREWTGMQQAPVVDAAES